MIVSCEQCRTQFQLDDGRIPPGGARVRCSLCKHAFHVAAPPGEKEDAHEPEVREEPEAAPRGSAETDAPARGGEAAFSAGESPQEVADSGAADSEPELESDWEFNEDMPFGSGDEDLGQPEVAGEGQETPGREALEESPPGGDVALEGWLDEAEAGDALGDPEEWDFFAEPTAETRGAAPAAVGLRPPSREPAPDEQRGPREAAADLEFDMETTARFARLVRIGHGAGALAVALLFAAGAYAGLRPRLWEAPPLTADRQVAGFDVENLDGRWIDNLAAGPLFVVSGVLRNTGPQPAAAGAIPWLRLVDADAAFLDVPPVPVGPELSEGELRERAVRDLGVIQARGARRFALSWLAPGQGWRFHAVFGQLPAQAVRLAFETSPLPVSWRDAQVPAGAEGGAVSSAASPR